MGTREMLGVHLWGTRLWKGRGPSTGVRDNRRENLEVARYGVPAAKLPSARATRFMMEVTGEVTIVPPIDRIVIIGRRGGTEVLPPETPHVQPGKLQFPFWACESATVYVLFHVLLFQ